MNKSFVSFLSRSLLIIMLSAFNSGCILENGLGGTGIGDNSNYGGSESPQVPNPAEDPIDQVTIGRITAFDADAIYVNGIRFGTDQAEFVRNGVGGKSQSDFSEGEVVRIEGTLNDDNETGVADKVIFTSILFGVVTSVEENRLTVNNLPVITNSLTRYHGIQQLNQLRLNDVVEISGYPTSISAVYATNVRLLNANDVFTVIGSASNVDEASLTFTLGDQYSIYYGRVPDFDIKNGVFYEIEVLGIAVEGELLAHHIVSLDSQDNLSSLIPPPIVGGAAPYYSRTASRYSIEGALAESREFDVFSLHGYTFTMSAQTKYIGGSKADLASDSIIQMQGEVKAHQGRIIADEIRIIQHVVNGYLASRVEVIDCSENTMTLFGQTLPLSISWVFNQTPSYLGINGLLFPVPILSSSSDPQPSNYFSVCRLMSGEEVYVRTSSISGTPVITEVLVDTEIGIGVNNASWISSQVTKLDEETATLETHGVTITFSSDTSYYGETGDLLTKAEFIANITVGVTYVSAFGVLDDTDTSVLQATDMIALRP